PPVGVLAAAGNVCGEVNGVAEPRELRTSIEIDDAVGIAATVDDAARPDYRAGRGELRRPQVAVELDAEFVIDHPRADVRVAQRVLLERAGDENPSRRPHLVTCADGQGPVRRNGEV